MANQYIKFSVQGVGGGRGPTAKAQAAVLQAYADTASKKKKKKDKENNNA